MSYYLQIGVTGGPTQIGSVSGYRDFCRWVGPLWKKYPQAAHLANFNWCQELDELGLQLGEAVKATNPAPDIADVANTIIGLVDGRDESAECCTITDGIGDAGPEYGKRLKSADTDFDHAASRELWREIVPPEYAGLFDASDGWTFDVARQEWTSPDGIVLTQAEQKKVVVNFLDAVQAQLQELGRQVAPKKKSLTGSGLAALIGQKLKAMYGAIGGVAVGGFNRLKSAFRSVLTGSVQKKTGLAYSNDRLGQFEKDIEDGAPRADTVDAIANRAGQYALPGHAAYEATRRASVQNDSELTHERNILGPAEEHCGDCVDMTELGWQEIDSLIPIGGRECSIGCRCFMEYGSPGEDEL